MRKAIVTLVCVIALVFGMASSAMAVAAGSCASDMKVITPGLKVLIFPWTSSSATGAVTEVGGLIKISGVIYGVHFVPSTGGTAPAAAYDVTILTASGMDVLMGVGADLPQAPTDTGNSRTPINTDGQLVTIYNETLTPAITNAGNSKQGTIYIFMSD